MVLRGVWCGVAARPLALNAMYRVFLCKKKNYKRRYAYADAVYAWPALAYTMLCTNKQ